MEEIRPPNTLSNKQVNSRLDHKEELGGQRNLAVESVLLHPPHAPALGGPTRRAPHPTKELVVVRGDNIPFECQGIEPERTGKEGDGGEPQGPGSSKILTGGGVNAHEDKACSQFNAQVQMAGRKESELLVHGCVLRHKTSARGSVLGTSDQDCLGEVVCLCLDVEHKVEGATSDKNVDYFTEGWPPAALSPEGGEEGDGLKETKTTQHHLDSAHGSDGAIANLFKIE
mmetsp:Transcript_28452/g.58219  ORF Transcript_28452/g.58219 Transcript_28452/m.58219 type:complete len:228 (+) Transcript_28452:1053-1736(+)